MMRVNLLRTTSLMSFACLAVITYAYYFWSYKLLDNSTNATILFAIYLFFFVMTVWSLTMFLITDPGFVTPQLLQKMNLYDKGNEHCQ